MTKFKYFSVFVLLLTAFTFTSCDDNELIDPNVVLNPTPSCAKPASFQASDFINGTNVNLSWVAGGEEESWEIQYGISGFALGSGTSVFSENTNITIANLVSTNNYQFYVRSNCAENEVSSWTGPIVVNSGTPPPPVSNGTFRVKIDGVEFVATSVTAMKVQNPGQQMINYVITGSDNGKIVTVQFTESNRNSYDIPDDAAAVSYFPNPQNPLEFYVSISTTFETIGNITVTSNDSATQRMSATFNSKVSIIDINTGTVTDTKTLTEGIITDVHYTIN